MKMIPRYLIIILSIFVMNACKPQQKQQPFGRNLNLENRRWVLRELNSKAVTSKDNTKEMFILFNTQDNTYGGSGNCNSMNGMYTVQDEMISIHAMASTRMACPNMEIESEYFNMLTKATRYELKKNREGGVDKETLLLYQDKIIIAKFDAVYI